MEHSFDINVAKKIGIVEAILLKHIYFWVAKNKANGTEQVEGHWWTYNTRKAFQELFPYLTARQIQYALSKLEKLGYILTANHNESKYDRTLWYTITEQGFAILQNCQMEVTKLSNGNDEIVTPIPNIKPYINADNIPLPPKGERKPKKRGKRVEPSMQSFTTEDAFRLAMERTYKGE